MSCLDYTQDLSLTMMIAGRGRGKIRPPRRVSDVLFPLISHKRTQATRQYSHAE